MILALAVPGAAQTNSVSLLVNSYRSTKRTESRMHIARAARAGLRGYSRLSSPVTNTKGPVAKAERLQLASSPRLGTGRSNHQRLHVIGPFSTSSTGDEDSFSKKQSPAAAASPSAPSKTSDDDDSKKTTDGRKRKSRNGSNGNGNRKEVPLLYGSLEDSVPGLRKTVWDQQDIRPTYPHLDKDMVADVVVVGGGIAGLSVAYNIAKAGKKVVVLEGRAIGSGQTGKTTAHLMPWNDDYYSEIEDVHGRETSALVGDSHRSAIDWVERVVKEEGIECEFERVDGYLFPHDDKKSTLDELTEELEASQRAGFHNVKFVDMMSDPKLGINIHTAIKFSGAADFHPLQYIRGLATAITNMGGLIFEQTRVYEHEGNYVESVDKHKVTAGAVVLATNSPINHNLTIHSRQAAERSYVVGLKVSKGEIKKAQWWDTLPNYHYVRIEEKPEFDVLIVGGGDHSTGVLSPQDYPKAWGALEKWARKRWPKAGQAVYWWTGQLYEPVDFLHLYNKDPLFNSSYVATGDSGQGMTGGTLAGMIIADLILGKPNRWADIYDTHRIPPVAAVVAQAQAVIVAHTAEGFADNLPLLGNDFVSLDDMENNTGAVINQGLQKLAVFKDGKGIINKFSAVCPHLKCAVKWNPRDATFDCPCHGSYFDTAGRCIQGPAKAGLTHIA